MNGIMQFVVALFVAMLFSQPFFLMFALTTFFVVRARRTGVWATTPGGRRWTRDEHPERFRLGVATGTAGACLFGVMTLMTFALVFSMFAFRSQTRANADLSSRLIGGWEMADGSDYVVEFTRDATMSVRNHAGEPQVRDACDENLPYRFISETVVGIPNRPSGDNVAIAQPGYFFVFSVSIEQDRLTLRGQEGGETIILSQDGVTEVGFPGSNSTPLEFIRRK